MFHHLENSLFDLWLFLLRWPHTPLPTRRLCRREQDSYNTGDFIPYSSRIVCGFFSVAQGTYEHEKYLWERRGLWFIQCSPHPRRLESLTISRSNYKGSTFSSFILRSWVLIRPGTRTYNLPNDSPMLNQLSQPLLLTKALFNIYNEEKKNLQHDSSTIHCILFHQRLMCTRFLFQYLRRSTEIRNC